jgi:hypothetical protein
MVSVRFIRTLGVSRFTYRWGGVGEKSNAKNDAARDLLSDRELKGSLF